MTTTLVIGYGNTLRSDDQVGVWIANRLAACHLPGVVVRTSQQLHLELVPEFARYSRVILVDASADGEPIAFRRCLPSSLLPVSTDHSVSPEILQHLAGELYNSRPDVVLCAVRGENFDFGWTLTPAVKKRAIEAVEMIAALVEGTEQEYEEVDSTHR